MVDPNLIASLITEHPDVVAENMVYFPTVQVRNTVEGLVRRHGYSASFAGQLAEGVYLYSIGGIGYKIRGDGSII